jgi:hypothetical protein
MPIILTEPSPESVISTRAARLLAQRSGETPVVALAFLAVIPQRSEGICFSFAQQAPAALTAYFAIASAIAASANGCIIAYPAPFGCTPSLLIPGFIPPSGPAMAVQ